jgi:hypothetical protein
MFFEIILYFIAGILWVLGTKQAQLTNSMEQSPS